MWSGVVYVDGRREHPGQDLQGDEDIDVYVLPLRGLRSELDRLHKEENIIIFDGLYLFAVGLELGLEMAGGNFDLLKKKWI